MKPPPIHLRHAFTLDIYDQEYVDDDTQCYHIAIAALGTILNAAGRWESWHPILDGFAVVNSTRFWFEEQRPVRYPAGMDERTAIIVLGAAFETLKRGGYYDGDLCSMPIELNRWLAQAFRSDVAAHVGNILHTAVNNNNAIASN